MVGHVYGGVMVVDYERQTKVSKSTGKKYYSYRLWVTADGEHMLEISTQSWNKWSFVKQLEKITTEWIYIGKDTYKEEVDEDGLTSKERRSLIKRFGYAGVYEGNRFWRADEYEAMKAEKEKQQAEVKLLEELFTEYASLV